MSLWFCVFLLAFLSVVCCLNQSPSKNTTYMGGTREFRFEYILIEVCLLLMPGRTFRSIFFLCFIPPKTLSLFVHCFPLLSIFFSVSFLLNLFPAVIWLQLASPVKPPAFPHFLPHAPIGHPAQPHQGAALPEVEVDSHCHHPADHRSLHLSQYF